MYLHKKKPLRLKSGYSPWHTCLHYRIEAADIVLSLTRLSGAFNLGIAPSRIAPVMLASTKLVVGTFSLGTVSQMTV